MAGTHLQAPRCLGLGQLPRLQKGNDWKSMRAHIAHVTTHASRTGARVRTNRPGRRTRKLRLLPQTPLPRRKFNLEVGRAYMRISEGNSRRPHGATYVSVRTIANPRKHRQERAGVRGPIGANVCAPQTRRSALRPRYSNRNGTGERMRRASWRYHDSLPVPAHPLGAQRIQGRIQGP